MSYRIRMGDIELCSFDYEGLRKIALYEDDGKKIMWLTNTYRNGELHLSTLLIANPKNVRLIPSNVTKNELLQEGIDSLSVQIAMTVLSMRKDHATS